MKWPISFSSEDDPSKTEIKTATLLSRLEPEDRQAREEKEEKDLAWAKEQSLKDMEKVRFEKDLALAKEQSLKEIEKVRLEELKKIDKQEDEQLPKTDNGQRIHSYVNSSPASISDRGKSDIEGGKAVDPQGLCCQICQGPFDLHKMAKNGNFHRCCYKKLCKSDCYVCNINMKIRKGFSIHQFWKDFYCPDHEDDGTAKCCSCERLEPRGLQPREEANYVMLDDYRWLCPKCIESSVMDPCDSVPLLVEMQDFFDSKALIIKKDFPILLVDKPALNEAETYEKIDHRNGAITRGLCLTEEQTVTTIITKPTGRGPRNRLTGMATEKQEVTGCEVKGILILYGLPRLLTGYILAHEMMHAWLRQNGYKTLKKDYQPRASEETTDRRYKTRTVYQKKEKKNLKLELEEGLCQVLALMWLESHTFSFTEAEAVVASSSSSSSSSCTPLAATAPKKGDAWSDFEKTFVEFCIHQIKEDESEVYGQGFKDVYKMMRSNGYSITDTLKEIVSASENISKS